MFLKLESLQRTGSFKLRGALNALAPGEEARFGGGVVTASAGNHGLGVAHAARIFGIRATIFIPAGAPAVKRDRIRMLGADVRLVDGDYDDAHAEALRHARDAGIPYLHAFSDPAVVAGQGTVGLEIAEDLPDVRTVVVPIGGGGLSGGIGLALGTRGRSTRLIGVQSEATAAMHASLAAGAPTPVPAVPTLCDGLAGDVDQRSLDLARAVLDDLVLVSESAVRDAIRSLFFEEGLVAEGSAAVGPAAIREGRLSTAAGPIAIVVTGGNIDAARLATILNDETERR